MPRRKSARSGYERVPERDAAVSMIGPSCHGEQVCAKGSSEIGERRLELAITAAALFAPRRRRLDREPVKAR
jgi:hypothetical protein